jgi:hypothetical protein
MYVSGVVNDAVFPNPYTAVLADDATGWSDVAEAMAAAVAATA